jgi:ABC-type amino acid transport substrate-binding protein
MKRYLTIVGLVLLTGACVPPEPVVDLSKNYTEDTVMGEIQAAGRLVIAVPDDAYPLGYVDQNDEAQGFVTVLGEEIADRLGVDAEYISGSSDQIIELPQEGVADIAFPATTMTESIVRKYQFSDPYLVAHQRLLVRAGEEDATPTEICSFADPETQIDPQGAEVTPATAQECLDALTRNRTDAVTGSDFLLAGLRLQDPERLVIAGDQLTTEGLGAVIEKGAAQWTEYVNGVLFFAKSEGAWEEAYSDTIGQGLGDTVEPPEITAEEAAALYPADL